MAEIRTSYEYTGGGTDSWGSSANSNTNGGECTAIGGTQGSALSNGGYIGGYNAESESYDGSSWSTTPANLGANQAYGSGTGTSSSDYLIVGGYNGSILDTSYTFDGSSWSSSYDLANARNVGSLMGTPADACLTGGGRFGNNDSEIFAGSSWATGPTPSDDRYHTNPSTNCGGTNGSATLGGGTGSGTSTATNLIMHLDKS
jgi:hypothetical protein